MVDAGPGAGARAAAGRPVGVAAGAGTLIAVAAGRGEPATGAGLAAGLGTGLDTWTGLPLGSTPPGGGVDSATSDDAGTGSGSRYGLMNAASAVPTSAARPRVAIQMTTHFVVSVISQQVPDQPARVGHRARRRGLVPGR